MFRRIALALSLCAVSLFSNQAQAGFAGDSLTSTLIVHTTGAIDQIAWLNESQTGGVADLPDYTGVSTPFGAPAGSGPIVWFLDFSATEDCFTLTAGDYFGIVGGTDVNPLTLTIVTGHDLSGGVVIGGFNTFGFSPGDISVSGQTITISSSALATLPYADSLSTQFCVVPEASTVAMMSIVACGLAGSYLARRRRNG
jgi:hypothetical protein